MSSELIISIDRELCMGSGLCVVYASGAFSQDGEAKAIVIDPITADIGEIQSAVEACPTGALSLSNGLSNEGV